jgi:hypothetical protein
LHPFKEDVQRLLLTEAKTRTGRRFLRKSSIDRIVQALLLRMPRLRAFNGLEQPRLLDEGEIIKSTILTSAGKSI